MTATEIIQRKIYRAISELGDIEELVSHGGQLPKDVDRLIAELGRQIQSIQSLPAVATIQGS